jgi:chloramphenicol-sensitive protein RarD
LVKGTTREGLSYGLAAYGLWGLVPLYFYWLKGISPYEVVAQRILWSAVFLVGVLTVTRRWPAVGRCLRTRTLFLPLAISSVLIAINWLVYYLSIDRNEIVQASLGYYILPLASVLIGLAVFRERLRLWQWVALGLASIGVIRMTVVAGEVPWIALTLAGSFGVYGAIRKKVPVDGLTGLTVETFLLLPVVLAYLGWEAQQGTLTAVPDRWGLTLLVAMSGVVTATPLLCFGQAARRLPLSTMGFLQYLSPTLQLVVAIFCFDEKAPEGGWGDFVLIWIALAIFSLDSLVVYRNSEQSAVAATPQPEVCES